MTWQVLEADCVEAMKEMDESSVDAVVTDPPYGLEFMGKEWDRIGARSLNPAMQANKAMSADEPEVGNPWASERTSYGTPKRNPRCRKCGKQKHNHPKSRCQCEVPSWDTEGWHYNFKMQEWHEAWATEALRVLKPGGHLLAFGGTRTYHRLACAIEDAGFEIRDSVIWLYGSGFPKSLDVSKAIDRGHGVEPSIDTPDPVTDEAKKWVGWGTAAKPAHEPIVVARKPLIGTVAQTVSEFGTGALNIDATRIHSAGSEGKPYTVKRLKPGATLEKTGGNWRPESDEDLPWEPGREYEGQTQDGRWPANCVLSHAEGCQRVGERRVKGDNARATSRGLTGGIFGDGSGSGYPGGYAKDGLETVEAWSCVEGCPVRLLDEQSGESMSSGGRIGNKDGGAIYGGGKGLAGEYEAGDPGYGDRGGSSRFFLTVSPDTLCVLCGLPYVIGAGNPSPPTESPSDTAPSGAQGEPRPKGEGKSARSDTPAQPAESSSRTTPGTTASTAPSDASPPDSDKSDPSARSAGNLCSSCETAIAQSVARWRQGQTPESAVGQASMPEHARRTLTLSLVLAAADPDSTGITKITRTLSESLGSARSATQPSIPTSATGTAPDHPRWKYQAKSSRAERNAGLEGFEERPADERFRGERESSFSDPRMDREQERRPAANGHPTVKPVDLMRWLVRLVTPPDGLVLDPFAGSGTTGIACVLEDFDFIGIEREPEYVEIARARIDYWAKQPKQLGLFGGGEVSTAPTSSAGSGRSIYGDYGEAVLRCAEHGKSIPSGSTSYRCGCPIQRGETPRRAA